MPLTSQLLMGSRQLAYGMKLLSEHAIGTFFQKRKTAGLGVLDYFHGCFGL